MNVILYARDLTSCLTFFRLLAVKSWQPATMLCYYVLSQTHIKDSVLIFSQQTIFIILDVQKLLDRKTRFRITCQFKTSASCHATRLNADNRWRSEHCLKHHKKVEVSVVSHIFLCISKIQILFSVSAGLFYGGQWPLAACLE